MRKRKVGEIRVWFGKVVSMNPDNSSDSMTLRSYNFSFLVILVFLFAFLLLFNPNLHLISFILMVISIVIFVMTISAGVTITNKDVILKRYASSSQLSFSEIDKCEIIFTKMYLKGLSLFIRDNGSLDVICYKDQQKKRASLFFIHINNVLRLVECMSHNTGVTPIYKEEMKYLVPMKRWIWDFLSDKERDLERKKEFELLSVSKDKRNFVIYLSVFFLYILLINVFPLTLELINDLNSQDPFILFLVLMFYLFIGFASFTLSIYYGLQWRKVRGRMKEIKE
ncbi:MAG: hypothetical protein ACW98F_04210 [Candidatus Hodarchaeales archaeon]